jgi:hypothetical protein
MSDREFPIKIGDRNKALSLVFQWEDELPELKPEIYDAMFPISIIDFVRMFPAILIDNRLFYLIEREDAEVKE